MPAVHMGEKLRRRLRCAFRVEGDFDVAQRGFQHHLHGPVDGVGRQPPLAQVIDAMRLHVGGILGVLRVGKPVFEAAQVLVEEAANEVVLNPDDGLGIDAAEERRLPGRAHEQREIGDAQMGDAVNH